MTQELFAALVAAQADMPAVEPNATNPHFKSKFVSLDHLIAKTRPKLNEHGLAIVQSPSHTEDGAPALTTTILHTSGQSLSSTVPLVLAKQDMQGLGAAITYARRYAWAAALGIASEEDDDGEMASRPSGKASTKGEPSPDGRPGGELDPAWNWRDWTYRMDKIGVPADDSREWLQQACSALGVESLEAADPDVRSGLFKRANEVLLALTALDRDLALSPDSPRATIAEAFAAAFDGAAVDGPTWRIHPSETDRPPQFAAPSAEELAEGESIPFGES